MLSTITIYAKVGWHVLVAAPRRTHTDIPVRPHRYSELTEAVLFVLTILPLRLLFSSGPAIFPLHSPSRLLSVAFIFTSSTQLTGWHRAVTAQVASCTVMFSLSLTEYIFARSCLRSSFSRDIALEPK